MNIPLEFHPYESVCLCCAFWAEKIKNNICEIGVFEKSIYFVSFQES